MTIGEKVGVGFLSAMTLACAALLFVPAVRDGGIGRGIFRLLPGWVVLLVAIVVFVAWIAIVVVNSRRRGKGKPPL